MHPAFLVVSAWQITRGLIPAIAVFIWKAPHWTLAAGAGLIIAVSITEWWVKKYSVSGGSLRVRAGLFSRTQHTIGINKITAVDAERGVLQRLFRVWGVKIQTPGDGPGASVHLRSLSSTALEELRAALDVRRRPLPGEVRSENSPAGTASPGQLPAPIAPSPQGLFSSPESSGRSEAAAPSGEIIAVLGTRTLLIAALTGTSIPLMLGGAGAAWSRAHDLLPEQTIDHLTKRVFVGGAVTSLIIAAALFIAVLAAVTLTSLRLARFTLSRDGNRIRVARGLIAQRSGTIVVDRVQAVRIVEGFWRRPLGYCALEVEVAGLAASNENERMLFPLIKMRAAGELVNQVLPELGWQPRPLTPVPARARRRYLTMPVIFAVAVTALLVLLPGRAALLALVPLPVGVLVGASQARAAAFSLDEATVILRWRRIFARHTLIARRSRVQMTALTSTVLQRRADLAGVTLLLSSKRRARIRHLDRRDARFLLHAVGRPLAAGCDVGIPGSPLHSAGQG